MQRTMQASFGCCFNIILMITKPSMKYQFTNWHMLITLKVKSQLSGLSINLLESPRIALAPKSLAIWWTTHLLFSFSVFHSFLFWSSLNASALDMTVSAILIRALDITMLQICRLDLCFIICKCARTSADVLVKTFYSWVCTETWRERW